MYIYPYGYINSILRLYEYLISHSQQLYYNTTCIRLYDDNNKERIFSIDRNNLADAAVWEPKDVRVQPVSRALEGDEPFLHILLLTTGGVAIWNSAQTITLA